MADAWEILIGNSSLVVGDAWEHLNAQEGDGESGYIVLPNGWEVEVDLTCLDVEIDFSELELAIEDNDVVVELEDIGMDYEIEVCV